ncbi:hypothetical protein [Bradyrhizobium macuxiense]|uniref:hypothetical protein n=1 Tax=Bradyrhizobium macuxiense TaxID=1755647 RepID=UPI0009EABEEB|nr:hypothetical protein [Bradyrhizobium macuxiense]
MRKLTVAVLAGTGTLIASSACATAGEFYNSDSSQLLQQTRLVCNDAGRCWHSRGDRVIVGRGETYYSPRGYYYDDDYDRGYYRRPGIGIYGPGFGIGVGPDW